ncbi:MAG: thioredoxin family protein [Myxococcaceae bacterium]|nr:thioredoxin family protein [Myxococcaceae bacterium]MBH2006102.1 thioredoxin family protein [Myxococcaceae bacterium]
MALNSNDIELGTPCPPFRLPSVDGRLVDWKNFSDQSALLVAFICNHCPYVQAIEDSLIALKRDGLQIIGICSNDANRYPDDAPEALLKRWREKNYGFPYLLDSDQAVAKAFQAVCTPDLFLYDQDRRLFYHGRIEELSTVIDQVLAGFPPPTMQRHSIGCSIKWT